MRASRFNTIHPWRGRWIVFNSLNGNAVAVDTPTMAALRSGQLERLASTTLSRLAGLGLAIEDEVDELPLLTTTAWPARSADVTVISARSAGADDRGLDAALEFISQHRGEFDLVKFRLCGWSERPIAERKALLETVRAACRRESVELVTLWTTDELEEVLCVSDIPADAFFFRWDLSRPPGEPGGGYAWDAVLDLIREGKSLVIQLAISKISDIAPWEETLNWAGCQPELVQSGNCLWDLSVATVPHPVYFLPSVCLEYGDPGFALLPVARGMLARLGIPVRPAIAPYRMHPGCPLRFPLARVYDQDGNRVRCLVQPDRGAHGDDDPRSSDAAQLAEQIDRCGDRCAFLPFCLARCPRIAPPVPDHVACARRKRMFDQELGQMLAAGHIPIISLDRPDSR